MNDSSPSVDSLYNMALNQLCHDKNILSMSKLLQPTISLQIIWKMLCVNNGSKDFMYNHTIPDKNSVQEQYSRDRGRELAHITLMNNLSEPFYDLTMRRSEIYNIHEEFAIAQQTKFVDCSSFSDHFDLKLLLNLVNVADCRGQLFTIFQICVQIKGLKFPKQLSDEWVKIKILNNNHERICHRIEQGLKLGIFLGDAGWLEECAQVLSHTYIIITTKWVCLDQNLKLLKMTQCLTKWLLVVSKLYKYVEAKIVLKHMTNTIEIIENIKERTFSMAYAYVAISQYYYALLEFDQAWSWAVEAIHELRDKSSKFLRLLVVNHAIRVCTALNRLSTAKNLINQLRTYKDKMYLNNRIEILLNEAFYSMKAELTEESINSYLIALDYTRNLFGYFNLNTAIALVDYAYARYLSFRSVTDYNEAMQSLEQGIFIVETLSSPCSINEESYTYMLHVNIQRIKALILEKAVLYEVMGGEHNIVPINMPGNEVNRRYVRNTTMPSSSRKKLLIQAENIHSNALEITLKTVGVKTLLSAKSFSNLGQIYQSQKKYEESEKMYLYAIEIKRSILDEGNAEIAISFSNLGCLYVKWQKKLKEGELLLMQSSKIFITNYVYRYKELLDVLQGLKSLFMTQSNHDGFILYNDHLIKTMSSRKAWLLRLNTAIDENCTKDGLSLEKFKAILNNSG